MPRWSQHAEDSFRLPEGFRRIGYDADTMRYTFADKNGTLYRGEPGETFGTLTPVAASATSMDRPGAFSDGNSNSKPRESSGKLAFSDFLPPNAMASASSSVEQRLPTPPPKAHFNGAVRTAIPKMQGVVQNLRRSITSAYTKGSAKRKEDVKSTAGSIDTITMLFNLNVAALVALALAMSAYAAPIQGPSVDSGAPPASASVRRDLPGEGPSARVNKANDSGPSYVEGKGYGTGTRKNVDA
ncbi:hypothetical protein EDD18DRAFT_1461122 [Armillaria luteobubalina]|uniref:Uncharacterized protein n=1 Tax=Armillaria luteobubalina TaxID=153913 RepID=A0AA39QC52_9AGAR|nr:hypothetical protein EDD18DRAFT_1461122 [Armillaria luteobubalina]